jgi:hypothetical protein
MRRIGSVSLLIVLCVFTFQHAALSADTSSLQLDTVTIGSTVSVTGTLALGTDATGTTKVGTDGSGDATVPRLGFDLGDAFITPNLAGKKLTLSLNVNDGVPGIDGIGPAAGYVWPLAVNGIDNNQWLAAGTYVSGWLPKTEKWFELCSTNAGSYTCGNPVTGTMSASQISWTVPFNIAGPASYGSTFEVGGSTPGAPGVIPWAVVSGGSQFDTVDGVAGYMIPGKVEVGIAPAGTPEGNVQYTSSGVFAPATSKFTVTAPKPAAGSYTLFAKSCFGLSEELTCLYASQPFTV